MFSSGLLPFCALSDYSEQFPSFSRDLSVFNYVDFQTIQATRQSHQLLMEILVANSNCAAGELKHGLGCFGFKF